MSEIPPPTPQGSEPSASGHEPPQPAGIAAGDQSSPHSAPSEVQPSQAAETAAPPIEINYETPPPTGNAGLLIRLAAIFNLVMGGLDVTYGIFQIGMIFFFYYMSSRMPVVAGPAGPGPMAAPPPRPPDMWVIGLMYGVMGTMSILAGTLKAIAGVKLLRTGRGTWGFGLAAAIVGCVQVWCSIMCVLPMAVGIYTLIILCMENVRTYLRAQPTYARQENAWGNR